MKRTHYSVKKEHEFICQPFLGKFG